MKLIIDIGNTRVKVALFENKELRHFFVFDTTEALLESQIIEKYGIRSAILGSVVNEIADFIEQLRQRLELLLFDSQTAIPIKNLYKSAHTLGSDRLAAAIGANAICRDQDVLVVDAGTCIKYNYITSNNEYIGGGISPGLQMRFRAMNTFTSRLPLLQADESYKELIGTNSDESIRSGAQLGAVAEIDGIIEQYRSRFNNLKVFLTGGDTDFFAKRLKNRIFADPDLILKGLNEILDYNNIIKNQNIQK